MLVNYRSKHTTVTLYVLSLASRLLLLGLGCSPPKGAIEVLHHRPSGAVSGWRAPYRGTVNEALLHTDLVVPRHPTRIKVDAGAANPHCALLPRPSLLAQSLHPWWLLLAQEWDRLGQLRPHRGR